MEGRIRELFADDQQWDAFAMADFHTAPGRQKIARAPLRLTPECLADEMRNAQVGDVVVRTLAHEAALADRATPVSDAFPHRAWQVWLDFACVPQSPEHVEDRLAAIDSIPWYIHHATNFFAVVPRIDHSDLAGVHCDYNTWQKRGWCRLEEQMQVSGRRELFRLAPSTARSAPPAHRRREPMPLSH